MDIVKQLAERNNSWMKFTIDFEEKHKSGKVPMLDLCVWREGGNSIKHEFYEKSTSSKFVTMSKMQFHRHPK